MASFGLDLPAAFGDSAANKGATAAVPMATDDFEKKERRETFMCRSKSERRSPSRTECCASNRASESTLPQTKRQDGETKYAQRDRRGLGNERW